MRPDPAPNTGVSVGPVWNPTIQELRDIKYINERVGDIRREVKDRMSNTLSEHPPAIKPEFERGVAYTLEATQSQIAVYKAELKDEIKRQGEQEEADDLKWRYETQIFETEKRASEEAAERVRIQEKLAYQEGQIEQIQRHALLQESAKNALVKYCQGLENQLNARAETVMPRAMDIEPVHRHSDEDCPNPKTPASWTWFPEGVLSEEFMEKRGIDFLFQLDGVCIPTVLDEQERRLLIDGSNEFEGGKLDITCPILVKDLDGHVTAIPVYSDEVDNSSDAILSEIQLIGGCVDPMFMVFFTVRFKLLAIADSYSDRLSGSDMSSLKRSLNAATRFQRYLGFFLNSSCPHSDLMKQ